MKNCLSFFLARRISSVLFSYLVILSIALIPFILPFPVSAVDVGCSGTFPYCSVDGGNGCQGPNICTTSNGVSATYCCSTIAPINTCPDPNYHRVCQTHATTPPTTDPTNCVCDQFSQTDQCGGPGQIVCKANIIGGFLEYCEQDLYAYVPSGGGGHVCAKTQAEADGAGSLTSFNLCKSIGDPPLCESCATSGGVWTAVGCIPTTRKDIVTSFLTIAISLSGGIILLRLLQASFMLSTSQGEPNKVKEAQEIFTSSFAGLLFVLFSIVILNTIGVNILQIPGF